MTAYLLDSAGFDWADGGLLALLLAGLAAFALLRPHAFCYPLAWLVTRTVWRLHRYGDQHIPRTGPALIVSSHVSYVDWLLIWIACRRRVQFVTWNPYMKKWPLNWFLRWAAAIPLDTRGGPKAIVRGLQQVADVLKRGELVMIHPETRLTRTGYLLPFTRGFEKIAKFAGAPVIPAYIAGMWGSLLTYGGGRPLRKWPRSFGHHVTIAFGPPLPTGASAREARTAVVELAAECDKTRDHGRLAPHRTFFRLAARHPFWPCFIDTSTPGQVRELSYGKSAAGALCIANWLKPRLGPDERYVGVWLPSSVGSALANVALTVLGKIPVNLNYTAGIESVRAAARQCNLKHVVTARRFLDRIPLDLGPDVTLILLEDARAAITKAQQLLSFLRVLLLPGWLLDLSLGLRAHRLDELATIVFSSGSTGEPKGVMLSRRNLAANAASMVQAIDFRHGDVLLGVLPLFHSFGYTVTLWVPLTCGAVTVYHPDPREAKVVGDLCRTHKATIMLGTATFLRFYLRRCGPDDFRTLRLLICGAEKMPVPLAREFEAKFGVLPLEGYGCTEVSPVTSTNIPDREIKGVSQIGTRMGTIGQPIPGVAVRAADPDTDTPLPPGQEGNILITGANVMVGYLHQPELTRQKVRNGWYDSGDRGFLDEDGFITITGRVSRFAKMAGEMVPLEKMEEEMHAILETNDRVLALAAVPDERRGERVAVLHLPTLALSPQELCRKLTERGLPNLWLPSERDFYEVAEMPTLGSGKLDLKRVSELAREKAGG